MNLVEWMKGICYVWSGGRNFLSPSMPGDRFLKLSSQKRSPGRNLGQHRLERRSGTASRGTVQLVLKLRMRSFLLVADVLASKLEETDPTVDVYFKDCEEWRCSGQEKGASSKTRR